MAITFITGNTSKYKEARLIITDLTQLDIDLPEIQSLDAQEVITAKIEHAQSLGHKNIIVEDTSLYISSLNNFPGPLIKWFLKSLKSEGIARLISNNKDNHALAKTIIGYSDGEGKLSFFEGEVKGSIVMPSGDNGFGWDNIFVPNGQTQTFAEMTNQEKNNFSMRKIALLKLKEFIHRK